MDPSKLRTYQNGAEGFICWAEDNVRFSVPSENSPVPKWIPIRDLPRKPDPRTGRSWWGFWCNEKEVMREALRMDHEEFVYRLIILCWMRGEGKSVLACLIQLWKFFCFPRQNIVLGANSRDQVKFVHYDIMRDIILNSPPLLKVVGRKNVQEKHISLKDPHGNIVSTIKAISSFSGIVSNITGYTFSEIFDMKDPRFFVQLDGSTRNTVNALGTIDSTVSSKDHILHRLYQAYQSSSDRTLFFHYRRSPEGDYKDFWHPKNTQQQLNAYYYRFPAQDFNKYFKNIWNIGSGKLFSKYVVDSIFYMKDAQSDITDFEAPVELCKQREDLKTKHDNQDRRKNKGGLRRRTKTKGKINLTYAEQISSIEKKLIPVDNYCQMNWNGVPRTVSAEELTEIGEVLDTDWAILAGCDRADPMAQDGEARTINVYVAKGLPGSRSNKKFYLEMTDVPEYVYFLVYVDHVVDSSLEGIKNSLRMIYNSFDGIDSFCAERWGIWDLAPWCEDLDIVFEAIFPNFEKQRKAFSEIYTIARSGRLKSPIVYVQGSQSENILEEEMKSFDYDPQLQKYKSPQKNDRGGVQDDCIFSLAWCIYGGRNIGIDYLRRRDMSVVSLGEFYSNQRNLFGDYKDEVIQYGG